MHQILVDRAAGVSWKDHFTKQEHLAKTNTSGKQGVVVVRITSMFLIEADI
jgi:hypothetical protein